MKRTIQICGPAGESEPSTFAMMISGSRLQAAARAAGQDPTEALVRAHRLARVLGQPLVDVYDAETQRLLAEGPMKFGMSALISDPDALVLDRIAALPDPTLRESLEAAVQRAKVTALSTPMSFGEAWTMEHEAVLAGERPRAEPVPAPLTVRWLLAMSEPEREHHLQRAAEVAGQVVQGLAQALGDAAVARRAARGGTAEPRASAPVLRPRGLAGLGWGLVHSAICVGGVPTPGGLNGHP